MCMCLQLREAWSISLIFHLMVFLHWLSIQRACRSWDGDRMHLGSLSIQMREVLNAENADRRNVSGSVLHQSDSKKKYTNTNTIQIQIQYTAKDWLPRCLTGIIGGFSDQGSPVSTSKFSTECPNDQLMVSTSKVATNTTTNTTRIQKTQKKLKCVAFCALCGA